MGAVHIAGAKRAALQIAELVEHEQRMIAGAAEMAVVGRAFLLAMGRANGAVHVEPDDLQPVPCMHSVDPDSRKSGERGEVVVDCQQLSLEPAHLAGRCAAALDSLAADDPPHRGIAPEPVGVVHILVSGEPSKDGLAKQTDDTVPTVLAGPAVSQDITRQYGQAQGIVEFAVGEQAGVGCDPRTVELQLQPSVETGPKWAAIRFTLRVRIRATST